MQQPIELAHESKTTEKRQSVSDRVSGYNKPRSHVRKNMVPNMRLTEAVQGNDTLRSEPGRSAFRGEMAWWTNELAGDAMVGVRAHREWCEAGGLRGV